MNQAQPPRDFVQTLVLILCIAGLSVGSFLIMLPFLPPLLWGSVVVISTWPLMLRVERLLWGKRGLAVTVMTVFFLMVMVVPLGLAVQTISSGLENIRAWAQGFQTYAAPPPPDWVRDVPLIGGPVSEEWQNLADSGQGGLVSVVVPYAPKLAEWFVAQAGSSGLLLLHFLLTVAIASILYSKGEIAADGLRRFAGRLAGERGDDIVILASKAIRGVALGVVVTALVQSMLAAVGLLFAGVPAVMLLTAIIFVFCLASLPPTLVLIPAVIWVFYTGDSLSGTLLLVWSIPVGTLDSFLRPYLIKRGVDLPLLLVFAGVLGGLVSMGIVGIFVGPTVLAVTYTLLQDWVRSGEEARSEERVDAAKLMLPNSE